MSKITIAIIILLFSPVAALLLCTNATAGTCTNFWTQEESGSCDTHEECGDDWTWCNGLPDVNSNNIPDYMDNSTICGYVDGDDNVGVAINIAVITDVVETDEDGYYAIGDLPPDHYVIVPDNDNYVFDPRYKIIPID